MTISKKLNPTNRYDRVSGPKIPWGYEVSDYDPYLLIPVEEMEVTPQLASLIGTNLDSIFTKNAKDESGIRSRKQFIEAAFDKKYFPCKQTRHALNQ